MIKIDQILEMMGEIAPKRLAEDWDNVGVQVGDTNQQVKNVLIALDLNKDVLEEAKSNDCQLIITHHPLIFNGIKSINSQSESGRLIMELIKNNITLFSAHTNLDIVEGGLNDYLAEKLNLTNIDKLSITDEKEYYKLVVFVPENSLDVLKEVLYKNGAGHIGKYSHSGFSIKGKGTFKPLAEANPHTGNKNEINEVSEYRLETIIAAEDAEKIKRKIMKAHPYEEPVWDLFKLENIKKEIGLGRIGYLQETRTLGELLEEVKEKYSLEYLKYSGDKKKKIDKIALCSGSGADFIKTAAFNGADLYLTGDVKYHEAQLAEELGMALIDFGHYGSEKFVKILLYEKLLEKAKEKNLSNINFFKSQKNTNPWNYC
jgi:dinuclear metal center YbgI/SA1388 family protein